MRQMSISTILIIILLLVSFVLRLSHIKEATEFFGDQGRTVIHVYDAWQAKTIPLVGPTVLSGQYLGPAYYFLIAPFLIMTRFDLVSGAYATVFYGLVGIVVAFLTFRLLFTSVVAIFLTMLWAFNPMGVASDRFLWEPNLVSVFAMMFILGVAVLFRTKKWLLGSVLLSLSTGILVQLHYPNLLFVPLSGVVIFIFWYIHRPRWFILIRIIGVWGLTFVIMILPFLYYELAHNFENLGSVITQFLQPTGLPMGKRQIVFNFIDYANRVMGRVSPVSLGIPIGAMSIIFLTTLWVLLKRDVFSILMFLSFVCGVGALSLYKGVVYDHYLYFLTPTAYIVIGHWIEVIGARQSIKPFVYIGLFVLCAISVYRSVGLVYTTPPRNDIGRVRAVVDVVKKELGNEAFSFGLAASPSFSDLHYRAGFKMARINAEKITGSDNHIVLVCESNVCPFIDHGDKIQTFCNEDHCKGDYPIVDLYKYKTRVVKIDDVIVLFGIQ